MFTVLLEAAIAAGAVLEPGLTVAERDGQRFVFADGGRSPPFDLLVDALGVRSPLDETPQAALAFGALWLNLPWPDNPGAFPVDALSQRYRAAEEMAGVMPVGCQREGGPPLAAFFWSLPPDAYGTWRARPLAAWVDAVGRLWPAAAALLDGVDDHDQLVFAQDAHRMLNSPVAAGLAHVGDSWRCASPQLGQVANMALLDAFALWAALERQSNLETALSPKFLL